jgi:hypothetical protein
VLIIKDRVKYENFLIWFVTPQDDNESRQFKERGNVDDYIAFINSIPAMSDEELLDAIDFQLEDYHQSVDRQSNDFINT